MYLIPQQSPDGDEEISSYERDEEVPLLRSSRSKDGDIEQTTVGVAMAGTLRQSELGRFTGVTV